MPLSFESSSHGPIPFGFFNIETDLLLMDRYFFFAEDFCEWIIAWTDAEELGLDRKRVYVIQDRKRIGDLGGAIHGYAFTGFIGDVYKLFPFPQKRSGFKQKPYGRQHRSLIEAMIRPFAGEQEIPILFSKEARAIGIGDYEFSAPVFRELIQYVQAGGMPGWLDGRPPDCVGRMAAHAAAALHWPFA